MNRRAVAPTGDENREEQLRAFGPVIRGAMLRSGYSLDSCIGATRIAIDVLKSAGITNAYALVVEVNIFNKAYRDKSEEVGRMPNSRAELEQWYEECGAHSVGIGLGREPYGPNKWPGHLVTIVDRKWLWDLSLDQAARPEKGIVIPEPLIAPVSERFLRGREPLVGVIADLLVRYEARVDDKTFRDTPNWINSHAEITGIKQGHDSGNQQPRRSPTDARLATHMGRQRGTPLSSRVPRPDTDRATGGGTGNGASPT